MNHSAVKRCIDAVFIPERITQANRHIISSCLINCKLVGSRTLITQSDQCFRYRNHTAVAVRLGIVVNDDFSKFRVLLFCISGQISSAVIGFGHQRIGIIRCISAFHVIVHMGQCPRSHIVIIPIGNYRNERLRRRIIGKVVNALHPVFRSIIGVGCTSVVFAQVLRRVINLPVPTVGRHTEEYLVGIHHFRGIIVNTLKPTSRRNRTWCRTRPSHTVTHDGCRIAIFIQITVYAPVLSTNRAVDRSHTRQADVHFLCGIIGFYGFINVLEHCRGFSVGGIIITFFQVDIHAIAPRVLLHNTDKFGAEGVLCAVRVITQSLEDRVRTVISNSKQPTDVRPFIDIRHHAVNCDATFGNCSGLIYFE